MDINNKNIEEIDFQTGHVLLVDKPLTWTSFDVVNKIRYHIKQRLGVKKIKVGHAGTLDPLATGLLIICTGAYTKRIDEFQNQTKEYTGVISLGGTTASYDLESEVDTFYPTEHITAELIEKARVSFLGDIEQYPPIFSAIKMDGKPIYLAARAGKEVEVKSRPVTIHEFEITKSDLPEIHFRIVCSKGTYIRSIANDFGVAVESGGHLSKLRRTKSGEFDVDHAWSVEELVSSLNGEALNEVNPS